MLTALFGFLVLAITLWLASRVLERTGYSPWLALLGLIPLVNIVLLWVYAWANWPRMEAAGRMGTTGGPGAGPPPPPAATGSDPS